MPLEDRRRVTPTAGGTGRDLHVCKVPLSPLVRKIDGVLVYHGRVVSGHRVSSSQGGSSRRYVLRSTRI